MNPITSNFKNLGGGGQNSDKFSSRLAKVKSVFTKAYEDAKQLSTDISAAISQKNAVLTAIQSDIKKLTVTKEENDKFMANIQNLLK